MVYGTWAAWTVASPTQSHFAGSAKIIPGIGKLGYIGVTAFVINVVLAVVLTFVLKAVGAPAGQDETVPSDYTAEAGDPGVAPATPVAAGSEA